MTGARVAGIAAAIVSIIDRFKCTKSVSSKSGHPLKWYMEPTDPAQFPLYKAKGMRFAEGSGA